MKTIRKAIQDPLRERVAKLLREPFLQTHLRRGSRLGDPGRRVVRLRHPVGRRCNHGLTLPDLGLLDVRRFGRGRLAEDLRVERFRGGAVCYDDDRNEELGILRRIAGVDRPLGAGLIPGAQLQGSFAEHGPRQELEIVDDDHLPLEDGITIPEDGLRELLGSETKRFALHRFGEEQLVDLDVIVRGEVVLDGHVHVTARADAVLAHQHADRDFGGLPVSLGGDQGCGTDQKPEDRHHPEECPHP